MGRELFTTAKAPLSVQDAVAALITTGDGRYLMQLRDMLPHIWFPGHWGCFGGAIDPGESPETALRRELAEELDFHDFKSTIFTQFDYDLQPMGLPKVYRKYFEVIIEEQMIDDFVLGEGEKVELVEGEDLLVNRPVTPYDAFAIWLHSQKDRLLPS